MRHKMIASWPGKDPALSLREGEGVSVRSLAPFGGRGLG